MAARGSNSNSEAWVWLPPSLLIISCKETRWGEQWKVREGLMNKWKKQANGRKTLSSEGKQGLFSSTVGSIISINKRQQWLLVTLPFADTFYFFRCCISQCYHVADLLLSSNKKWFFFVQGLNVSHFQTLNCQSADYSGEMCLVQSHVLICIFAAFQAFSCLVLVPWKLSMWTSDCIMGIIMVILRHIERTQESPLNMAEYDVSPTTMIMTLFGMNEVM